MAIISPKNVMILLVWQFEADGVGCQIVVLCPVLGKFTKISSSLGIQL